MLQKRNLCFQSFQKKISNEHMIQNVYPKYPTDRKYHLQQEFWTYVMQLGFYSLCRKVNMHFWQIFNVIFQCHFPPYILCLLDSSRYCLSKYTKGSFTIKHGAHIRSRSQNSLAPPYLLQFALIHWYFRSKGIVNFKYLP